MLRACLIASALLVMSIGATAADVPKDISAEDRAEWLAKAKDAYAKERAQVLVDIEEAETLAKFTATADAGKKKLAVAKSRLASLDASPASAARARALVPRGNDNGAGTVGHLRVSGWQYIAGEKTEDGLIVDGVSNRGGRIATARFLVASPFEVPKPKGKGKEPEVTFPGLWYVAGTVEYKGKPVPVLYKFEVTNEDIPPVKK